MYINNGISFPRPANESAYKSVDRIDSYKFQSYPDILTKSMP